MYPLKSQADIIQRVMNSTNKFRWHIIKRIWSRAGFNKLLKEVLQKSSSQRFLFYKQLSPTILELTQIFQCQNFVVC